MTEAPRHCNYPICGKELVRRSDEKPSRFAQRHFCGKECRSAFVAGRKTGVTYAKKVKLKPTPSPQIKQIQKNLWVSHRKRPGSYIPDSEIDALIAAYTKPITYCPPMGALGDIPPEVAV